jgi:hypothetical protein
VRGATPQNTYETTIIEPAVISTRSQVASKMPKTTRATRTMAEISQTVRTNRAVLR